MCGIVGYVGSREAAEILLDGLRRLEYRGYDSAGLAVVEGAITLRREVGKIAALVRDVLLNPVNGKCGIGHTRWATHGRPTQDNAHPHTDCRQSLAIVHNGIIENYMALKMELLAKGHSFLSETDTEVLAHLVETTYRGDLAQAVYEALQQVQGTYAIAIVHRDHPNQVVAARYGSPLVLGLAEAESYVASDIPAILPYTRRIVYLEERDLAVVTGNGTRVYDSEFRPVTRAVTPIDWTILAAEKGDYPHFMLKEIHEQPKALGQALNGRLNDAGGGFYLAELQLSAEDLRQLQRIEVVACGTSYYAGMIGDYFLEGICGIPTKVELASEFRYRKPVLDERMLVIAISQSGETADTLAAVQEAKARGARVIGIVNVPGSALSRLADSTLYLHAGPEIGVASTKAFTSTVAVLQMLALHLGLTMGKLTAPDVQPLIAELRQLPQLVEHALALADSLRDLARRYVSYTNFVFLGRGVNFPIALEGALKLKELSYIHAEGIGAGEIKHGPIAMIDPNMPVLALATQGRTYEKMLGNLEEVKARYGRVIALVSEGDEQARQHAHDVIVVPRVSEWLSPVVNVVPLQLFAYYVALLRECDVDQPRNLAKSVTVE